MSEVSAGLMGSLLLVESQSSPDRLLMYEFTMPFLKREKLDFWSGITSENARMPLFVVFVGVTLFYQFYLKPRGFCNWGKKKEDEQPMDGKKGLMEGFRKHA